MDVTGLQDDLKAFGSGSEFFIGIDSDGCVFDSMEVKHRQCFCPNFITHWGLENVAGTAREVWYFVNLYSGTRGINRFRALVGALNLMKSHPAVDSTAIEVPDMEELEKWIGQETRLGNPALEAYLNGRNSPVLERVLKWSRGINNCVAGLGPQIRPLPEFRKCIGQVAGRADIMVVSQTPLEALESEWTRNGIRGFVDFVAGQEHGTKSEHLRFGAMGKYEPGKILMIGDAPGDLEAATENGVLFYPILPGRESESWERFSREAIGRFFNGLYKGSYQESLLTAFRDSLPDTPPWDQA